MPSLISRRSLTSSRISCFLQYRHSPSRDLSAHLIINQLFISGLRVQSNCQRSGHVRAMVTMQLTTRLNTPVSDEIIEDSEPEREAARKRRKEERQRRSAKSESPTKSVITGNEITSHMSCVAGHIGATAVDVIDLTLSSSDPSAFPDYLSSSESAGGGSIFITNPVVISNCVNTVSQTGSLTGAIVVGSDDELEETTSRMRSQLNQFAFSQLASTSRLSRTPSLASNHHAPSVDETKQTCKTRRKKDVSMIALVGFTEKQLVPLRKCVSCNIAWTTRKTAAQKLSHIKTCARKAKIMDETLRDLIMTELESLPLDDSSEVKGKRKKAKQPVEVPSKSLLDDVVRDGQVQRLKKRQATVSSSVKDVAETRDVILDKARQLLRNGSDMVPHEGLLPRPPTAQTTDQSRDKNTLIRAPSDNHNQGPPLTQAFGTSSLANRFSTRPSLFSAEPPSTQAFAPSRLGFTEQSPSCWAESTSNSMVRYRDQPFLASTSCQLNEGEEEELSSVAYDKPKDFGMDADDGADFFGEDEAILVYEPDRDIDARILTSPNNLGIINDQTVHMETEGGVLPTTPKSTTKMKLKTTLRKNKKAKEGTKGREKIVDEEEFSSRLKALILDDNELYLRVLRYEPLHFDVFLSLVQDDNINATSLKTRVKAFLDKHAIHYHENDIGQRNRRH